MLKEERPGPWHLQVEMVLAQVSTCVGHLPPGRRMAIKCMAGRDGRSQTSPEEDGGFICSPIQPADSAEVMHHPRLHACGQPSPPMSSKQVQCTAPAAPPSSCPRRPWR